MEGASATFLALDPQLAVVALDDAMDDGQFHAVSLRPVGMKSLKDLEETAAGQVGDAKSVVADPVVSSPVLHAATDLDLKRAIGTPVLEGVADQVGEDRLGRSRRHRPRALGRSRSRLRPRRRNAAARWLRWR